MNSITLHYSEPLVRRAVRAFWWRTLGWRFPIAILLVLFSLISLVASGDRSWFVGAIGAVLALGLAFGASLYVVHYRGSVGRFRRMSTPEATFEPEVDRFRLVSDAGLAECPWKHVKEVWRFPEFWLVFLAPGQFITLPTADLDGAAREFVIDRIKAHGGRIA
jgi:hypothetical protein